LLLHHRPFFNIFDAGERRIPLLLLTKCDRSMRFSFLPSSLALGTRPPHCIEDDDVEAQAVVDKATVACGVFSSVQGRFRPAHDEESAEERYVLVHALEECSAKVFGTDRLGFQIAGKLDSIAPSLCAPWLSVLKSLASSSSAMSVKAKSSAASLANVWPELGGRGGLRSTRWRARAMAADLAALLSVHELTSSPEVIHQLLHLLIHGLALTDSEWQVLKA
jgi:hypothetical protein